MRVILIRTKSMNVMLEMKRNELCMILQQDEDDPRDALEQGAEDVHLRGSAHQTTPNYQRLAGPWLYRKSGDPDKIADKEGFDEMHLVARWKYIICYRTEKDRLNLSWTEKSLVKMREDDRDVEPRVSDEELRRRWRGVTVKGGSGLQENPQENPINLRESNPMTTGRKRSRLDYTRDETLSVLTMIRLIST